MEHKEMDLSAVRVEEVQSVLNAMQKILECPICLELIKEPVSTRCDHIFCKFCMLKLLDQKRGPSQCPLCKNNITKRSLQESTRFSQLVEELLKVIHAFELDCSVQVTNSYSFSNKESNSAEHVKEEVSIIQSMGYRNRAKRGRQGDPESPAWQETSLGIQLSDLGIMGSLRTRQQTQPQNKSVYIELGSDSSEDTVNKAYYCSMRDRELLLFTPQGTKAEASSDSTKQSNATCEVSEKGITDTNCPQPSRKVENAVKERAAKRQPERHQGGSVSDLRVEPCGTKTRASSLQRANSRLLLTEDRMDVEKAEFRNKSKQPGPRRSQQSRWAKSKGSCANRQTPRTEQEAERIAEPLHEREEQKKQKPPCSEDLRETQDVPWITLNSSIQKVNEWFSRSDEMVTFDDACDRESEPDAEEAGALEDPKDLDDPSGSSVKIDLLASDPLSVATCASERGCPRAVRGGMEDKVFGRTYGRKASLPSLSHTAENRTVRALAAEPPLTQKRPLTSTLKHKRRTTSCLHPEDFIKNAGLAVAENTPGKINQGTKQTEKSRQVTHIPNNGHENETKGGDVQRQKSPSPVQSLEKESASRTRAEPQSSSVSNVGLELKVRLSEAPRDNRLRRKSSARHVPQPSPPDHTNSTSSEEIKGKNSQQVPVRHGRKLPFTGDLEASAGTKEEKPGEQGRKRSRAGEAIPEPRLAPVPSSVTNSSSPDKLTEFVHPSPQKEEIEENPETLQGSGSTRDPKDPVLSGEKCVQTERSAESTSVSLVPDTDCSTQDSVSLLVADSCRRARRVAHQCVAQYVAVTKPEKLLPASKDTGDCAEGFKEPLGREVSCTQGANTEMEDSELDTQYLQNTFQSSKRQSFALFSNPGNTEKGYTTVCAYFESFEKQSPEVTPEYEQPWESQGEEEPKVRHVQAVASTTGAPVLSQNDQPGAGVKCSVTELSRLHPSQVGGNEAEHITADKHGILRNLYLMPSISPVRSLVRSTCKKTCSTSLEEAVGSESILQSTGGHSLSRACAAQEASSGSGNGVGSSTDEVGPSSENIQAQLGRNRGPELDAVLRLGLMQPEASKQSLPVGNCKPPEVQRRGESGVAGRAVCADFSPCRIVDSKEQPVGGSPASQICSETPDGLLGDEDSKEDTSLAEGDIKETSAVFSKGAPRRQLSRSPSPVTHTAFSRSRQRRVRKLESSEEHMSSEDEELPCFQHLIFGKGTETPQSTRPSTVATEHVPKGTEGSLVSLKNGSRDCTHEPALAKVSPEPQQGEDIRCSGSLFSSQCSAPEDSAANTNSQDPFLVLHPRAEQRECPSGSQQVVLSDKDSVSGGGDREADLEEDSHHTGQSARPHLDEAASGSESEANCSDGCSGLSSQSSILTTQQRDTIQDNLLKLQQEMAHLEAVLERHGSPHSGTSASIVLDSCPLEELPTPGCHIAAKGLTAEGSNEYPGSHSPPALSADVYQVSPDCPTSEHEPGAAGASPPKSLVADGRWSTHSEPRGLRDRGCPAPEQLMDAASVEEEELGESGPQRPAAPAHLPSQEPVGTSDPESGNGLFSDNPEPEAPEDGGPGPAPTCGAPASTSALKLSLVQVAPHGSSPAAAQTSNPASGASREGGVSREELVHRRVSMVVSGLTSREWMLAQKFARKYHMRLSGLVTEETTHVVMKTDADLVCERTLKYFLGIAGGKWVVSYFWVTQSMKERRVLDERSFEVRGDVVNGRNHQGPRRARESEDRKIFSGLDVCCFGPFTNMPTDQLEWMLRLCGATVVREPSSLPLGAQGAHPIVVVQPDAWTEDSGFLALEQLRQVPVVTREWVLDSVALHQRQELDAYLVPWGPHGPCCLRPPSALGPQDPEDVLQKWPCPGAVSLP
ncbi:PREDICTED: breast cancer type 1 susceptibility protein isoform X2 [Chinchilla lanigera]|nr:PREDICTED: breast cancer type 1 susceptibility protein isoform X2 [Chinchilla lanigera]